MKMDKMFKHEEKPKFEIALINTIRFQRYRDYKI